MDHIEIKEALKNLSTKTVIVTFTKKSTGETRVMHCTTNLGAIPTEDHPKGTGVGGDESLYKVYDVNKSAWRSFRLENVTNVEVL